ncbi:MAG: FG-GAP-like repeat-containing protein [Myxococcota bacterium]
MAPSFGCSLDPSQRLHCFASLLHAGAVKRSTTPNGIPESCGDGVIDEGEECDDRGESASCDDDCTFPECGDGVLNASAGEACDDGGNSPACDEDCTLAECGDGLANPAAGEDCDDTEASATCDDDCTVPECGDGTLNLLAGETCEDGNQLSGDGCSSLCALPVDVNDDAADITFDFPSPVFESAAVSGDFNGDGFDDVLLGDLGNDDGGASSGAAFIFFGSANPGTELTDSDADVKLVGEESGDSAGARVASAGDFNGDGIDDILVGAPHNDSGGTESGIAYLINGDPSLSGTIDLANATARFVGEEASDRLNEVASAGDFDGDGFDDIAIGSQRHGAVAGAVYVLYGGNSLTGTLDIVNANLEVVGEASNDFAGRVSSAGDVNGDGVDDLLIGASGNDEGGSGAGAAYMIFGSTTRLTGTLDLADADLKLVGQANADFTGVSVAAAGDVDADGFDDILVGASGTDKGDEDDAGTAYLVYGSANLNGTINFFKGDTKLLGENANDSAGRFVGGAGDVNGDGFDDILVAAPGNDQAASNGSAVYLLHGPVARGTLQLADADVKFVGSIFSLARNFIAGGGDINGDGFDDIAVGFATSDARVFLGQP